MPDVAMCSNKECKFKEDCYRFTAKPDDILQTYAEFKCESKDITLDSNSYFWDNSHYKTK